MNYPLLNIDRLHNCVQKIYDNEQFNRCEGKTTALLYLMLGYVWVGHSGGKFVYVTLNNHECHRVLRLFAALLWKEQYHINLIFRKNSIWVKETDQIFVFTSYKNIPRSLLNGTQFDDVFVDTISYDITDEEYYNLMLLQQRCINNR